MVNITSCNPRTCTGSRPQTRASDSTYYTTSSTTRGHCKTAITFCCLSYSVTCSNTGSGAKGKIKHLAPKTMVLCTWFMLLLSERGILCVGWLADYHCEATSC